MNKEEPFRSQAERLKRRIEKVNEETTEVRDQLPPREQIHREKRKKTKWKIKYPIIRILVLFFILLPIVIFSVYSYLEEGKGRKVEKVNSDSSGYEVINFEKPETESTVETREEEKENAPVEDTEEAVEVQKSISPESSVSEPTTIGPSTDKNVEPAPQVIYHTVKSGENLYRISLKYYHSKAGEETIRKANNISGNEIYLGQVLKIPLSK